ncbi:MULTISPECIES: DUF3040 domain-containing protein [unclassified Curtobacterium]|uniref:DUF3040 domain-containing protein n=2 Tax=unclassified Curtobacterium TaxID=257496 RepID=UPI000DA7DA88|nr:MULTISPECIES: DUF3040 domain-containing protein [unclassified Curtobacterium]PZE27890.1 hypothetical protein DEI86_04655 [Curtobacterium sp. MCBD17_028]PZE78340.1 hypothetical protein DEI82_00740 [Curtobacterium sp. MCBD17_019]PZF59441.1 hypothetical protein DEI81_13700 [Curtobacterium sp. MCBD17_013]WIB67982.1 DUF3040 domain-containing protein [Curtobacterium sp. MCBD17_035]WIE55177.1 DUF3040 domain-containing protein [Curtobacterium sp. MCBD17_003]
MTNEHPDVRRPSAHHLDEAEQAAEAERAIAIREESERAEAGHAGEAALVVPVPEEDDDDLDAELAPSGPSIAGLLASPTPRTAQASAVSVARPGDGGVLHDPDLLAAPNRANARRATRRNVLIASIGFVVLGLVLLVIAAPTHAPISVPIVLIVAGLLGAALSLVLRRDSREDREPSHGSAEGRRRR